MTDSKIMCLPSELFDAELFKTGLTRGIERFFERFTSSTSFQPRATVETDTRFKQVIPYIIIVCNGRVLSYERGRAGGEKRLHGQLSIGVGGHIEESDTTFKTAALRELHEELPVSVDDMPDPVALLLDNTTPVGLVHVGFVSVLHLDQEPAGALCPSLLNATFVTPEALRKNFADYERWSQFCISELETLLTKPVVAGAHLT